jgi:hypothetical protein
LEKEREREREREGEKRSDLSPSRVQRSARCKEGRADALPS